MIPLGPVVARSRLRAARTAAWAYLSEPERRAEWWPELQLEPNVGGAISERWSEDTGETSVSRDASGTVDVWVEGHALGFRWREAGDERETAVLVTLRTQGEETGITVTETGFDALPEAAARAAASQDGWQVLLRDLTTALEAAVAEGRVESPAPAIAAPIAAEEEPAAEHPALEETAADGADEAPVEAEGATEAENLAEAENPAEDDGSTAGDETDAEAEAEAEAEGGVDTESDDDTEPEDLDDTIRVEPLTPEAAAQIEAELIEAAENEAAENEAAQSAAAQTDAGQESAPDESEPTDVEEEPTTAELDFDALIRGDLPDGPAREH